MGIKSLIRFLNEVAPACLKEVKHDSYTGRVMAIDASTALYQFMIAIRDTGQFTNLTNEAGEITSHLTGMLSRTVKFLEHGIKPVYVFDGKPPEMKKDELAKRSQRRGEATENLEKATEEGNVEEMKKLVQRTVKVTKKQNEDVQKLLRMMGVPVIEAPSEAEAECANLAKHGVVFGAVTEDADALCFGTPVLVKHLNFSTDPKKIPVEVNLEVLLRDTELSMDQFIDFCILCGCDYCGTIRGIGPRKAYDLILAHKTIEEAVANVDLTKHQLPENFDYATARRLFQKPDVLDPATVKLDWTEPDFDGLRQFLIDENNFNETRTESFLKRLKDSRSKTAQTRLESFFGAPAAPKPKAKAKAKAKGKDNKRKSTADPGGASKKAKK
eukprot:Platyproteum_vivax@DN5260_c0_g1_i1.p1